MVCERLKWIYLVQSYLRVIFSDPHRSNFENWIKTKPPAPLGKPQSRERNGPNVIGNRNAGYMIGFADPVRIDGAKSKSAAQTTPLRFALHKRLHWPTSAWHWLTNLDSPDTSFGEGTVTQPTTCTGSGHDGLEERKVLGSGTFGIVWCKKEERTRELRAVKVICKSQSGTQDVGEFARYVTRTTYSLCSL